MANVNSFGSLISTDGRVIPVLNTATTEATQDSVDTDGTWTGSVQNVGTYADQMGNFVLGKGVWRCETGATWNYIRSAGVVKAVLPMANVASGGAGETPASLPYPKKLESGDSLEVMANSTNDREVSIAVACSNREYHVFAVTPAGASSGQGHELISVVTGQGIGTVLQDRVLTHWYATNGNNTGTLTSDIMLLDGAGVAVATVAPNGTGLGKGDACLFQRLVRPVQIKINSKAVFTTDA